MLILTRMMKNKLKSLSLLLDYADVEDVKFLVINLDDLMRQKEHHNISNSLGINIKNCYYFNNENEKKKN